MERRREDDEEDRTNSIGEALDLEAGVVASVVSDDLSDGRSRNRWWRCDEPGQCHCHHGQQA
jgi:hypothetical protein